MKKSSSLNILLDRHFSPAASTITYTLSSLLWIV
jgi:hypothetical protein